MHSRAARPISDAVVQEARRLMSYCPETGIFTRLIRMGAYRAGIPAGSMRSDGYVRIRVLGSEYLAHRIAWRLFHGEDPVGVIDHIDHDPSNNSISNLRDCSNLENQRNRKRSPKNRSGHTGVSWETRAKKWRAGIKVKGVNKNLGLYKEIEKAIAVRRAAELHYGFFEGHGT